MTLVAASTAGALLVALAIFTGPALVFAALYALFRNSERDEDRRHGREPGDD